MADRPLALVYDWDNTLVDAWAGIAFAQNAVFREFGRSEWSVAETRANVRGSLRDVYPEMFGEQWERARDIFYATLRASHLEHVAPLPGSADLIATCTLPQAVVSNKAGDFLRAEIAHLGWGQYFGAVLGAGDAVRDKPDPAPIHEALAQLGLKAGPSIWYIGDTALDMQAAKAAGVTAVLLGDAAHDGGIAHAAPHRNFLSATALATAIGM